MSPTATDALRSLPWPLLLGHRGSRTAATENTLAAIVIAAAGGADGVEIDVRCCASGELVVFHDPTLERLGDGVDRRAISSLTRGELRRLTLRDGGQIPSLEQVLDLCRKRQLALNIEMKRDVRSRRQLVGAVARCLAKGSLGIPLLVSSFDPLMLGWLHVLAPRLPKGLLIGEDYRPLHHAARLLGAMAVHPERSYVSRARVRGWHRRGLRVITWTVNEAGDAERLLALGVDGIISDDPARLRAVVRPG